MTLNASKILVIKYENIAYSRLCNKASYFSFFSHDSMKRPGLR